MGQCRTLDAEVTIGCLVIIIIQMKSTIFEMAIFSLLL